jgi:hypothetical protein
VAYTRLPKSLPESFKFEKKQVSNLHKAKVHEKKAEKLRSDKESKPHLEFLERWKALEFSVEEIKKNATKELAYKLGQNAKDHHLLGHLLASLPKPRLDLIFADERIGKLNLLLAKRTPAKLINGNEGLAERGITHKEYLVAKRDLKFGLGLQAYKASQAVALYLTIVRYAIDRKTRRKVSLMSDDEVMEVANGLMRDIVTHVVDELKIKFEKFYEVGDRSTRDGKGILKKGRPIIPGRKV